MGDSDRIGGTSRETGHAGHRFPPPPPVFLHNPGVLTEGERSHPLDVPIPGRDTPAATAPLQPGVPPIVAPPPPALVATAPLAAPAVAPVPPALVVAPPTAVSAPIPPPAIVTPIPAVPPPVVAPPPAVVPPGSPGSGAAVVPVDGAPGGSPPPPLAAESPWTRSHPGQPPVELSQLPSNYAPVRAEIAPPVATPRAPATPARRRSVIVLLGLLAVVVAIALVAVVWISQGSGGGFGDPLKLGAPEDPEIAVDEAPAAASTETVEAKPPPPPPPPAVKPPPPPESIYDGEPTGAKGPGTPPATSAGAATGTGTAPPVGPIDKFDPEGI